MRLELALWLESDRMGFLLEKLDREKLTNQRDVVRNERRQGENQPYQLSEERVYHLLFPEDHPYYASVIGSHADIESARLLDVRNFFHSYYTPNNANLAIAGDFDKAKLKQLVEKYFGPIPKGPEPPPVTVKTPPITSQKTATVTDTVQLPEVSFAWLMPPAFQPGDADAEMLMAILGGGKASRLYRKLVYDKQIAQSADCTLDSLRLGSVAECDVIARPGIKPEDLQREIEIELKAIREQGPTQAELDGARNTHLTGLISGLQRLGGFGGVADRMDYYNYYTGDPGYLSKDVARFQHVSVASVRKLAQTDLVDAKSVVVTTVQGEKVTHDVPRSPADTDANVKVENPYPASFETAQDWRKTAPTAGPLPAAHLPVPKVFTLDNGLHVYLVEDHSLPVINASVITLAGGDANPANKPGLSGFTALHVDRRHARPLGYGDRRCRRSSWRDAEIEGRRGQRQHDHRCAEQHDRCDLRPALGCDRTSCICAGRGRPRTQRAIDGDPAGGRRPDRRNAACGREGALWRLAIWLSCGRHHRFRQVHHA